MTRYPLLNDFDLFDDVFGVPMFSSDRIMRTDVEESDDHYTLKMDLPGYQKEDVTVSLNRGNLTISAKRNTSKDEKDDRGNILRQERFTGNCSRTFSVGTDVKDTDIHASFKDGILTVTVPKVEQKKELPEHNYITIE
ncbi:MAG: Hsp20/alpha crystallin family protein [Erysipelotrichaceae bacterium]|nr:Hsp20/alpha crystallin family protein [Erysipelotrichaceae bacterium]